MGLSRMSTMPIIPLEAVGDRSVEAQQANLFDMQAKYGDVLSLDEVLHYLRSLES